MINKVCVIGGGGYVGTQLVEELLKRDYYVTVYDLFIYGNYLDKNNIKLKIIYGDIRDLKKLGNAIKDNDAIIHLACISNDPSFELNPELGKSINFDCFEPLVKLSVDIGIKKFIFASTSSVYGIKNEENVTEELSLEPLTDYSKYKALCEEILFKYKTKNFTPIIIRPATVCGMSKRLRLDLIVNIFANFAYHKGEINIFGGNQKRPNIHIDDIVSIYIKCLNFSFINDWDNIYNAGWENRTVNDIANELNSLFKNNLKINHVPTNDNRSYHISSDKLKSQLRFVPEKTIKNACEDLISYFNKTKTLDTFDNDLYYNIKRMNNLNLK